MTDAPIEIVATGEIATLVPGGPGDPRPGVVPHPGDSVAEVLAALGLAERSLLVILNERVIAPAARAEARLAAGDRLTLAAPIRAG